VEDIDTKSKGYKKSALSNLFILNNSHYVLKSLKGTKVVDAIEKGSCAEIEKTIKKQLDLYRDSWMPILNHLVDQTKISDNGRIVTTLSKQQRDAVKENFKNFNKDFDEICTAQMKYAIPDVELRAQVIREIKAILLPMYNRFYDKYTDKEFSKTPEKYIKYTKETLGQTLDKFFEVG
jgi:exocyst complex component 7